jgi:starch-binding outer membrane protein, SusD/RagB family
MKKIIKLIIIGLIGLSFNNCSDLKEQPFSFFSPDQFYKTASDAEAALTAVYGALNSLYSRVGWQVPDYSADQMFPRAVVSRDLLTTFNYDATLPFLAEYWSTCYQGINNANALLVKIGGVSMDVTRKKEIEAEAKFMRAVFYFHLTKNFGDIPIRKEPVFNIADVEVGKSPIKDVYRFIIEDLNFAEGNLPTTTNVKGRPIKLAATALLAKVQLYNEDFTAASTAAKKVIDSKVFDLMPDVVALWDPNKEDANRKEMIFAVEYTRIQNTRPGTDIGAFNAPAGSAPKFTPVVFGSQFAFINFFKSFDIADKRRALMDTSFVTPQGLYVGQGVAGSAIFDRAFIRKYEDPLGVGANQLENNFPIIRFADILLIHAEAEAKSKGVTADALASLNKVRRRAYNVTTDKYDQLSSIAVNDFINIVLEERKKELCFEADRWYDLTRTGKFLQIANVLNTYYTSRRITSKNRWFPIPASETQVNSKLEQNPEWK